LTSHIEANCANAPSGAIVIADDAIHQLAAYARENCWRNALLVMDPNTEAAAGTRVAAELTAAGIRPEVLRFAERSGLKADDRAVAAVRGRLGTAGPDALIAVGSGVVTDIVRYAAHLADRDFVSVPTAASMDGYASGVAALERDGVKVTYPARPPRAIFAEATVLAAAPSDLTRAGLGDLLAKATAGVDWLAAHLLYGEPYHDEAARWVAGPMSFAAGHVDDILRGEPEAVRGLALGLIESGIAMAIAGSSRPASGSEHHVSHFWDLQAARGRRRPAAHGLQVGYASRFAMRLQRFAFGGGVTRLAPPRPGGGLDAAARAWLGEPGPDLLAAVAEKRRLIAAGGECWPRREVAWARVRDRLAPALEAFPGVGRALEAAGIPAAPGFLDVDPGLLRASLRYANRLRDRYTVIDFLEGQGALDEAIEAAVEPPLTSDRGRGGG
jgi:glycerol-1-phosphate dehydrogenase [NAD(P)+]